MCWNGLRAFFNNSRMYDKSCIVSLVIRRRFLVLVSTSPSNQGLASKSFKASFMKQKSSAFFLQSGLSLQN